MANPSKQKGTGAETELKGKLGELGIEVHRTAASSTYDLDRGNQPEGHEVLATRPDHGRWLVTVTLEDWAALIRAADGHYQLSEPGAIHIEVKRYSRFALHTIFEKKFGGKK